MRQVTTDELRRPAETLDPEVLEFRSEFGQASPLDELVRQGAQQMLQSAIEMEVDDFLAQHADRRDGRSNRLVVRNGYLPSREILTGAGRLSIEQPRVRDNFSKTKDRVRFSSSILPPYLRRSKALDELIPWLYLKGSGTRRASLAMMFKLAHAAQKRWRRLNGHAHIIHLLEGKTYSDGLLQDAA
jgi:putative transposase